MDQKTNQWIFGFSACKGDRQAPKARHKAIVLSTPESIGILEKYYKPKGGN